MDVPYTLIIVATLAQFFLGALWYSRFMFGRWWHEVLEISHLSHEEMSKRRDKLSPFYAVQIVLTGIFTWILAFDLYYAKMAHLGLSPYAIAGGIWIGFIMPVQVAGVVWGNTNKKLWFKEIVIVTSYQLVGIMLAAWLLSFAWRG
ncbi:hypothetical protein COU19_02835 [Candidatus Kaiserbacteria bacterium CG10_big_fil_rev_8_21_14_0_10_56_12]|uniref:DUF1761 domain-containing protein n=1 Tax=Candidatus Kaiserbacteria bacterium CG10_big_fil_rev_8_21_14_0_10_56_12 TaxID=1974611 RepID=A0A2H0UB20_9BACT|nr:MAG: hypothetical protein COU19_02835 [Candidatus Kaiserbacteria bacterium CG10_big_fil_rev_8_21_14_0_10_56_12]